MRLYAEAPPGAIGVNNPIRTIRMPITGNEYNIYSKPIAFEGDIIDINLYRVELGYCIGMDISRKAALRLTMINPGWRVFLLVNDQAVGVRQFDTTSFEGRLYMFLEIPDDEMAAYVEKLRESCMLVQELKKSQQ